jgi:hypothetical protein
LGVTGIEADCFAVISDGLIQVALGLVGRPAVEEDSWIGRIKSDRFAEVGNGAIKLAFLFVLDAAIGMLKRKTAAGISSGFNDLRTGRNRFVAGRLLTDLGIIGRTRASR